MTFVLPEGLAPEVYPLAWLVGTWRGEGVLAYPGVDESAFVHDLVVGSDGGPYLSWTSVWRLVQAPEDVAELVDADVAADPGPVWSTETGFWRVPPERPVDLPADKQPVELLLADPSGHVDIYVGAVGNGRIDLVSDVVVHTATGAEVAAGTRLLGLVDGDLMWAHDLAAFGHPLQSYASARLSRVLV
ncbi:MAG: FABP family protein [Actinobacteria bacterium]|nr:FABP family protein [Actinomycetota bacterium]MCG2802126.1 FABP family protein [Cellulomonas sp.]